MRSYLISLDGDPVDDDLAAAFEVVEVDERVSAPSTFLLTLRAELGADGRWSHLDDDRFALFTPVAVSVGNGDRPVPERVVDGYLTSVSLRIGSEPGTGFLDLRGVDPTVLLGLEEKVAVWPDLADSDIAEQILDSYDLDFDVTATAAVRQDVDTTVVQRGTDAAFLRTLARRNGYEFSFSPDAYFGPPRLGGESQPDVALRAGAGSNLRSFTLALDGVRPLAVAAAQVDPRTREVSSADVTDSDLETLGSDAIGDVLDDRLGRVVTPDAEQARVLLLGEPSADPTVLTAAAQGVRDEASWAVSARGELNPDAYPGVLRSGRTVGVRGVGETHSGTYYVTRVTHRLTSDGVYGVAFEARRNAVGAG